MSATLGGLRSRRLAMLSAFLVLVMGAATASAATETYRGSSDGFTLEKCQETGDEWECFTIGSATDDLRMTYAWMEQWRWTGLPWESDIVAYRAFYAEQPSASGPITLVIARGDESATLAATLLDVDPECSGACTMTVTASAGASGPQMEFRSSSSGSMRVAGRTSWRYGERSVFAGRDADGDFALAGALGDLTFTGADGSIGSQRFQARASCFFDCE